MAHRTETGRFGERNEYLMIAIATHAMIAMGLPYMT